MANSYLQEDPAYVSAWEAYRKNHRAFVLLGLTYLPGAVLLYLLLNALLGKTVAAYAPFFVFVVCAVGLQVFGWRAKGFRCPRCGQQFFNRAFWHSDFARKCVHCGLPKYAMRDPDK